MSSARSHVHATADEIHSAAIRLLRIVRAEDVRAGVAPAQLSALSVLVFAGPKSLSELAAMEQVKPPTMSAIVQSLLARKLVERATGDKDRRMITITATAKGRKLLLAGRNRRVRALARRLQGLSLEDLEVVKRAAQLLSRI